MLGKVLGEKNARTDALFVRVNVLFAQASLNVRFMAVFYAHSQPLSDLLPDTDFLYLTEKYNHTPYEFKCLSFTELRKALSPVDPPVVLTFCIRPSFSG